MGLRKFIEKIQSQILLTKDSVMRSVSTSTVFKKLALGLLPIISSKSLERSLWIQSLGQDY